jgi:hypothetical protein
MFLIGYRKGLTVEDLYPLDCSFNAQALHEDFVKNIWVIPSSKETGSVF